MKQLLNQDNAKKFLSIRWKLLLILFGVSVMLGVASSFYFQNNLQAQFEKTREKTRFNHAKQLNGLVVLNVERIRQLTIALPNLVGLYDEFMSYESPEFYQRFDTFWSNFQLDMGVDDASLYSLSGHRTATWGGKVPENAVIQSTVWQSKWSAVLKNEVPASLIECSLKCHIYAFSPVLKEGKVVGVFSIGASLADAVLAFRQTSDANVMIMFADKNLENTDGHLWGMRVEAASNSDNMVPLIKKVSLDHPFSDLAAKPIRYVDAGQTYEVSLVNLDPDNSADGMQLIVIDDITSELAVVKSNGRQVIVMASLATLLLSALLYLLLSVHVQRLRRIATAIPLLGQGAFEQLRQVIKLSDKNHIDEVDVLNLSAVELSYTLESLIHEIEEQNLSLKNLFDEVSKEKEFAISLLNQADAIIATTNVDGCILSFNRFGHVLTGMGIGDFIYRDLEKSALLALQKELIDIGEERQYSYQHEMVLSGVDKSKHTISWVHSKLRDDNKEGVVLLSVGMDVTEQKKSQAVIHHLAYYDALTDLPNRRLLLDRLKLALVSSARSHKEGALLLIDLDDFKSLNDTLGHHVGDMLLQEAAKRITACVREDDTVARIGGDEFMVMLVDLSSQAIESAAQAETIASKIQHQLNQPFQLGPHVHSNTLCIGITLFYNHDVELEELLKQADIAMFQAKHAGGGDICFYDPKMQLDLTARVSLERELHQAVAENQFSLYYQIQVDSAGHALGAEALIRWQHPEQGMISPFTFIPLAEQTGLIIPIGQWVLETACAQLKLWQQASHTKHLTLSVNVSPQQFCQADFVSKVEAVIKAYDIDPMLLKLELTESALLDNVDATISTMAALKRIGIKFSLDDFGTGYSSLQYLKRLPLYQLKIDQSFVRDIADDVSDQAIVRTIIAMAQTLNLNVIAEGVETEEQRQLLLASGCMTYQGYLFGKPMPIDEFEAQCRQSWSAS